MTAQILRFPGAHIARPADPAAQLARDLKATVDSMDADLVEMEARARRIRRLLMLRATAAKRLAQQERVLKLEKQLRMRFAKEQAQINDIREMFNHPA